MYETSVCWMDLGTQLLFSTPTDFAGGMTLSLIDLVMGEPGLEIGLGLF